MHLADVAATQHGATALFDRLPAFTQEKAETIPPLLAEAEKRAGEEDIAHGGRAEVLWQWVAAEMNAAGGETSGLSPTTSYLFCLHAGPKA